VTIFEKLFNLMAEKQASDIYVTAGAPIQIKIQGHTMPINQQVMDPATIRRMLAELVTPEQMERFERERELNISRGVTNLGNFRINAFWQRNSVGIVMRFIQSEIPTLASLRLPPVLADIVMEKRGLVLVVGATGSGKSTTLASMIDHRLRNRTGHILTVEDPIEYLFRHSKSVVNQREVGIDTHSWAEALRNAMRQAPDCILIGEIRDRETMPAAIAYAQTGHLCLATLHANNGYQALNRILSFYPVEVRETMLGDLASALRSIVSQRLVRTSDGERVPAAEVMLNTKLVAELIENGDFSGVKDAMEKSMAEGSQTFEEDLARLIMQNRIDRKEGLAYADSPTNLMWRLQNDFSLASKAAQAQKTARDTQAQDEAPSFTEIVLDVRGGD
jgi:pilus retraction protein PilT